jgi:hypothetical protein
MASLIYKNDELAWRFWTPITTARTQSSRRRQPLIREYSHRRQEWYPVRREIAMICCHDNRIGHASLKIHQTFIGKIHDRRESLELVEDVFEFRWQNRDDFHPL